MSLAQAFSDPVTKLLARLRRILESQHKETVDENLRIVEEKIIPFKNEIVFLVSASKLELVPLCVTGILQFIIVFLALSLPQNLLFNVAASIFSSICVLSFYQVVGALFIAEYARKSGARSDDRFNSFVELVALLKTKFFRKRSQLTLKSAPFAAFWAICLLLASKFVTLIGIFVTAMVAVDFYFILSFINHNSTFIAKWNAVFKKVPPAEPIEQPVAETDE